jgi:hypothetical protein
MLSERRVTSTSPAPVARVGVGVSLLLGVVLTACSKQAAGVREIDAPITATVQREGLNRRIGSAT